MTCLPCDLEEAPEGAVIYQDDLWSCEVADGYDVPGWFVLRARRHAEGWESLTRDEASSFGTAAQQVSAALKAATGAPTVYFVSFGENYPHLHFLVIARPSDLAPEHKGGGILALRADHRDHDAALTTAAAVREALVST